MLSFRLSAQDLITWTNYSGWDPETICTKIEYLAKITLINLKLGE